MGKGIQTAVQASSILEAPRGNDGAAGLEKSNMPPSCPNFAVVSSVQLSRVKSRRVALSLVSVQFVSLAGTLRWCLMYFSFWLFLAVKQFSFKYLCAN